MALRACVPFKTARSGRRSCPLVRGASGCPGRSARSGRGDTAGVPLRPAGVGVDGEDHVVIAQLGRPHDDVRRAALHRHRLGAAVTRTGTVSWVRTSSELIRRASSEPSTGGGTDAVPQSPISRSAASSGSSVLLCQKVRMAVILAGKSAVAATGAVSRNACPMRSKLSLRFTAAPTRLIAEIAVSP